MQQEIVICDIDGTLADISHRVHHITKSPKDWDSFFQPELIIADKCIEATRKILNNLPGEIYIILLTGRMEKHRSPTEHWLEVNRIAYDNLCMRKDDDYRHDDIIKEEVLNSLDKKRVLFVIEDRKRVVDMWRRNGIFCFQCSDGEF